MSQETKIARAALRGIGLGPIAQHVTSKKRKKNGTPFPTFAGSPVNFHTIPHWTKPHVRKAFLLAHQYHDPDAFMDKHGGIHCHRCDPDLQG